jgi:hypothetical protein
MQHPQSKENEKKGFFTSGQGKARMGNAML